MSPTELRVIREVRHLHRWADEMRSAGRRIALVPTMGALHEGHLSLVRIARGSADRVVVSIFVNPTQFGPAEDLDSYPHDLERDLGLLRSVGADVAFTPSVTELYPAGDATRVEVGGPTRGLCGRSRDGHFTGVTTVVTRLLLAAKPHVAVFGEKDYQQLITIRRLVQDLHFDVEIIGGPTVREPDGLAMSSRNAHLSGEARQQARALSAGLHEARELIRSGELRVPMLVEAARRRLKKEPLVQVEYIEVRDARDLEPLELVDRPAVMGLAASVAGTRLIDNTILEGV